MKTAIQNNSTNKGSAFDDLLDSIAFEIDFFRSELERVEQETDGDLKTAGVREALSQRIRQREQQHEQMKKLRSGLDQKPVLASIAAPLSKLAKLANQASISGGRTVKNRKSRSGTVDRTHSGQIAARQFDEFRTGLLEALSELADQADIVTKPEKPGFAEGGTAEMRSAITSIQDDAEILMAELERIDELLDEIDVRIPEIDWVIRFLNATQFKIDALQAALTSGADDEDADADATEVDH